MLEKELRNTNVLFMILRKGSLAHYSFNHADSIGSTKKGLPILDAQEVIFIFPGEIGSEIHLVFRYDIPVNFHRVSLAQGFNTLFSKH